MGAGAGTDEERGSLAHRPTSGQHGRGGGAVGTAGAPGKKSEIALEAMVVGVRGVGALA